MSCSVATSPSPAAFSPSRHLPFSRNPSSPIHETLTLAVGDSPSPSSFRRNRSGLRVVRTLDLSPPKSPAPAIAAGPGGRKGLKRKRELWIDVPIASDEGLFTADGCVGGGEERWEVEEDGEGFAVCCRRGRKRVEMEDRHAAALGIGGKMAFFGVFDGHSGKQAAQFASENMCEFIIEEIQSRGEEGCSEAVEEAVKIGYLKTDEEFLKETAAAGGACCVTALLQNGNFVVSNAGDCRAVLSREGQAEALTCDHRLSREDERDRVQCLGGFVDCSRGIWRLQGSLAVSRGIGDRHLKQWVTAVPETKTLMIKPGCEFLILASDGLWDEVSNQEAVDVARPLCIDDNSSPMLACKRLVDLSARRGSLDDISVMIIQLQHFMQKD